MTLRKIPTGNVVRITPAGSPDAVLENAMGRYEAVLVLGFRKDGALSCQASVNADRASMLWWVEMFKFDLLMGEE